MPPATFDVQHPSPNLSIGSHAPLLVLVFRDDVSLPALAAAEAAQTRMLERTDGSGTLLFTLIDSTVPLPADGTRRMVADTFKRMAARNKAAATTIVGDGFWASAMRSTLTALGLIVRPPCPQRTFADIPSALAWLGTFDAGIASSVPRLVREVETVRGRPA